MGARGPAPESKAKLERRGSNRAKARPDDLQLPPSAPKPPKGLNAEARAEWNRLVKLLEPRRVLSAGDRAGLTVLCELWAEDRELATVLKKHEVATVEWKRVFTARQDVRRQLKDMLMRFGLTPADRTRVRPMNTKDDTDDNPNARSQALRLIG